MTRAVRDGAVVAKVVISSRRAPCGRIEFLLLPSAGVFWTILEIFLWVISIWIWIWIFLDIFRSQDLSGRAKALWYLFVLFIPLVGVLAYLIVRGGSMHERSVRQTHAQEEEEKFRSYVQAAGGPQSSADQFAKLAGLRDQGIITGAEFEQEIAKILAARGGYPLPEPAGERAAQHVVR